VEVKEIKEGQVWHQEERIIGNLWLHVLPNNKVEWVEPDDRNNIEECIYDWTWIDQHFTKVADNLDEFYD